MDGLGTRIRQVLVGAAIAGSMLALAACSTAPGGESGPLVVLDWPGYDAIENPQMHKAFVEAHDPVDQAVSYSFFGDDAEAYAKMQGGFEADIVHPCLPWWGLYANSGLVQPLDTSKLSNWGGVDTRMASFGAFNGEQYFIPYDWGYESMLVRTDLVDEVPDSWADLWDPQYAGKIALYDGGENNHIFTALTIGLDPWAVTPEQEQQIQDRLIELIPNVVTYWSSYDQAVELARSGDAAIVVNTWQDAYFTLQSEGYDVAYVEPSEGRLGWICGFGISANAKHPDLAYEYLNSMLEPRSMVELINLYGYGVSNFSATEGVDPAVIDLMKLDDPAAVYDSAVFFEPLTNEQREMISNMWSAVKAAQ